MRRTLPVALTVLAAAIVVVLPVAPAQACSCAVGTVTAQYEGADAVFAGTLVSREVTHPAGPVRGSGDPALHVFAVDTVYKGEVHERQGVVSAAEGASCGLELQGAGPFLVFATRDAGLAAGQYAANLCGGTAPFITALAAEIETLGDSTGGPDGPAPGAAGVGTSGGGATLPVLATGAVVLLLGGWLALRRARRDHNPSRPASSPMAASK